MRSIILCEGPDDLMFSAYYLNKVSGWDECPRGQLSTRWPNYGLSETSRKQKVYYMYRDFDDVAIWCVAGKDAFGQAIKTIFNKFVGSYPSDPIDSIVIIRDRDTDSESEILSNFNGSFGCGANLVNRETSIISKQVDDEEVRVKVTPVIIPFDDCGAIESLLMKAIAESNDEGRIVVDDACKYVDGLTENPGIGQIYLKHDREVIKAKYAATIAVTNPGHSTGLFQDLVLSCPWEQSEYVKRHFDVVLNAITTSGE